MSDQDPYLLNLVSGKKPQPGGGIDDEIEKEYKKNIGRAEKERIQGEKEAAERKAADALFDKIIQYHDKFPFVTEGGPKRAALSKMCLEELEREMIRIKRIMNSKSALAAVKKLDYFANMGIEKFLIYNEVPAMGLADFTASPEGQEMLAQEYQELAIEYQDWLSTSVKARYFWTTVSKIMMVIQMNKMNFNAKVDPDLQKESEHLGESSSDE